MDAGPQIPAGIPADVLPDAIRRIGQGLLDGEFKGATLAALIAEFGLTPRQANGLYNYVKATARTTPVGEQIFGGLTGWVGDLLSGVLPILKIAAGGLGLLTVGAALVFVAGRTTRPGKAATGAAGAASKVADVAVPGRAAARVARRGARVKSATELARARTETRVGRGGRERIRTVSRREGRRRLIEEAELRQSSTRARPERGPEIRSGLPAPRRRRPAPKVSA